MFGFNVKSWLVGKPRINAQEPIKLSSEDDTAYINRMAQFGVFGVNWSAVYPYQTAVTIEFNGSQYAVKLNGKLISNHFDDTECYYAAKTLATSGKRFSRKHKTLTIFDVTGQNFRMVNRSIAQFSQY